MKSFYIFIIQQQLKKNGPFCPSRHPSEKLNSFE